MSKKECINAYVKLKDVLAIINESLCEELKKLPTIDHIPEASKDILPGQILYIEESAEVKEDDMKAVIIKLLTKEAEEIWKECKKKDIGCDSCIALSLDKNTCRGIVSVNYRIKHPSYFTKQEYIKLYLEQKKRS